MAEPPAVELASATVGLGVVAGDGDAVPKVDNDAVSEHRALGAPDKNAAEHLFPLLHNTAAADTESATSGGVSMSHNAATDDNDGDEPAVARPFHRTNSPDPPAGRNDPRLRRSVHDHDDDNDDDDDHGHNDACPDPDVDGLNRVSTEGPKPDGAAPKTRVGHKMHKFSLYETASRFYMVGADVAERRYRILKIDRTADDETLEPSITDDKTVYTKKDMNQLLDTIDDGNRGTGGLKLRCTTWGLLGFIKFTAPWYMLLITKKSTACMLGGHYVYQIDGTDLIPLTPRPSKSDAHGRQQTEESRYLAILNNLDLTRSFYYSYSYDITRTLQYNMMRERAALLKGQRLSSLDIDHNAMFVWNTHLLEPAARVLKTPYDWCRPIIHGYIDQAALSIYGRTAHVTIIARRSRKFAGARFLKRGANDLGYVANDVETEQVVSEALTTPFHAPGPRFFANPCYTSYVQHRGSIPLHWTQDNTGVTPKPPIELNLIDPFYTAAALHFDNLFERYGAPIYVLNLIKARERTPRESKLLAEYTSAIDYLNQFLPDHAKFVYRAWDMSQAAKSRDPAQDVIGTLERIAEDVLTTTGFFHNGDGHITPTRTQNGVARTNCIDCLDRTNAAQFVIGKRALGHQLHSLGLLDTTVVHYDTDAVNLFTHMWHDHGDTIAVQYGGSQLVNTMETYRKINQWTSQSRDMIESFKRYYNNSFLDGQRQEAYNLFLGNYVFTKGQPMLWDLTTDYYLHHASPRTWLEQHSKHNYIHWFTPRFLEPRVLVPYPSIKRPTSATKQNGDISRGVGRKRRSKFFPWSDDYWIEYYRPYTLSSFGKLFPFKMNSTIKFIPIKATSAGRYDLSPFVVRSYPSGDKDGQEKKKGRKDRRQREVKIVDPSDVSVNSLSWDDDLNEKAGPVTAAPAGRTMSLQRWLQPASVAPPHGVLKDQFSAGEARRLPHQYRHQPDGQEDELAHHTNRAKASVLEKSRAAQWNFTKVVQESLNPSVRAAEAGDYARYISHPHNLPLVVSAETPAGEVDAEYQDYISGSWMTDALTLVPSQYGVSPPAITTAAVVSSAAAAAATAAVAPNFGGSGTSYPSSATARIATMPGGNFGTAGLVGVTGSSMQAFPGVTAGNIITGGSLASAGACAPPEEDIWAIYAELIRVPDNPLSLTEEDAQKKRYKIYGKWLRGKSLFKQQPVD